MSRSELTVPEGTRLVHIGPHKTGSTAIQVAMLEAADQLAAHGVAYITARNQHRARKAGWALGIRGRPAGTEVPPIEHWERFAAAVAASDAPRLCVSNEDFGRAEPEQIERVVADLGGDSVHVVGVARRLDRYLPSQWQERVKAGDERWYDDWLRVVLEGDEDSEWDARNVWFAHDVERLVTRWVEVVGPDRFTLIVGNEDDRDQLPRTFEDLLGLPGGTLKPNPARSNRGLSWVETELIRSVNEAAAGRGWTRPQRRKFLVRGVLADMQARPAPTGAKSPPLPEWAHGRLRELSDRRVEAVRSAGVRVVGDPEWMRLPADAPVAPTPLEPPALDYAVAAQAIAAVMGLALGDE